MARKKILNWTPESDKLVVEWTDADVKGEFPFASIEGYAKPSGVTFELFRHGLKQKLADSVAGMGKAGETAESQLETMNGVWDAVCKGEFTVRKPAAPKLTRKDLLAKAEEMGIDIAIVEKLLAK